jgi:hypothetical protein
LNNLFCGTTECNEQENENATNSIYQCLFFVVVPMAIVASSFAFRSINACVTRAHTASSHVRSDSKVDDDDDDDDEAAMSVCAADASARARRSLPPTPSLFAKDEDDDDEEYEDEDEPASTRA